MPASKPERTREPPIHAIAPERWVAARALYEGTPGMTLKGVAEKTGLGLSTVQRKANEEGWRKKYQLGELTEEAQKAADKFIQKTEDLGPELTTEQKQVVAEEVTREVGLEVRVAMLDRHRREWAAARAMSVEAVNLRNTRPGEAFDRAKLAKITAETLKIIQDGERKAYGIDVGELPPGHVVVIDRA